MKFYRALCVALFLLTPQIAHAQKTKAALTTEVNTNFPDNVSGAITPAIMRATFIDVINSYVDWLTCTGTGGITYWSSGTPTCLAAGTNTYVLTMTGGVPTWAAPAAGSGTVTSVSFTGGLISVATATSTPALTVAGTSGGIPYFSSSSTWATSSALTANALVVGGGAGAAPSTVTTGTGIVTALGVNTGSAGAPAILIAKGTSALGTSAISSGTCATVVTTSATNVATTDVIDAGFNGDPTGVTGYVPLTSGMLTIISYPSANNVNFKVCNNTSNSITPGAITLNWKVTR